MRDIVDFISFNRTIVELKQRIVALVFSAFYTFNRTIVELKPGCRRKLLDLFPGLLIVP